MDNDEKALNLNYKSPFEFMGKKCQLGRTNMAMTRELRRLYDLKRKLPKMSDKEFDDYFKKVKAIIKQVISPITDRELDNIDEEDFGDIYRFVNRRDMKRRGFSNEEIEEFEEADRRSEITFQQKIAEGDMDFLRAVAEITGKEPE